MEEKKKRKYTIRNEEAFRNRKTKLGYRKPEEEKYRSPRKAITKSVSFRPEQFEKINEKVKSLEISFNKFVVETLLKECEK